MYKFSKKSRYSKDTIETYEEVTVKNSQNLSINDLNYCRKIS